METNRCPKLRKALYGLKQAPKAWNSCFNQAMISLGFLALETDACVYTNRNRELICAVYVDHGLILRKSQQDCLGPIDELNKIFTTKRNCGGMFLGIEIKIEENQITLNQSKYICALPIK